MNDIKKDNQIDKIEEFFLEVIELPEYKNIEYLVFSIRIKMLQLLSMLKNRPIPYECPYYLKPLAQSSSWCLVTFSLRISTFSATFRSGLMLVSLLPKAS